MILLIFKEPIKENVIKVQELKSQANSIMIETISGFETINGISIHDKVFKLSEKKYVKFLKNLFKLQNIYYLQNAFKEIVNDIGFLGIILIGFFLVINQEISLGNLLTFNALLVYFFDPIKNILDLDFTIREANNALRRVMSILIYKEDTGNITKLSNCDIKFNNLSYTYNDKVPILDHINFMIKQGSKVMLAGVSGGGKSTLMKLLLKYYPVDMNQIKIGEIDINNYSIDTIRKNIKYISQKEILFTDSLENNIRLDKRVDDSKFLKVSMICEIEDILNRNNLGYEMLIEENGFNLSGGEKQRIVLARTLLLPFKILIIDEGLEQVDVNQERRILKNLFREYQSKTIIFITHRRNNVDLFDSLITIKNGKIESEISKNVSN
jgi:ATP-binding cassette subfamily B protein